MVTGLTGGHSWPTAGHAHIRGPHPACPFSPQWNDFMELGNSIPESQLDQIIDSQRANQCAVVIYTSGTIGSPKGVMLSHDNVSGSPELASPSSAAPRVPACWARFPRAFSTPDPQTQGGLEGSGTWRLPNQ